jgi:cytochrome c
MAEKAAAFLQTEGPGKAVEQFQSSQGPFRHKELYVFVLNLSGEMIVHGASPRMAGTTLIDRTDPEGKAFAKEIIDGAKTKGNGWVDYKWTNPTTGKVVSKATYYVKSSENRMKYGRREGC